MSVHTVETNLSRIYRKLAIGSRTELAARLASARRRSAHPPDKRTDFRDSACAPDA